MGALTFFGKVKAFFICFLKPLAFFARPYVKAYLIEKVIPAVKEEVNKVIAEAKAKEATIDATVEAMMLKVENEVMARIAKL